MKVHTVDQRDVHGIHLWIGQDGLVAAVLDDVPALGQLARPLGLTGRNGDHLDRLDPLSWVEEALRCDLGRPNESHAHAMLRRYFGWNRDAVDGVQPLQATGQRVRQRDAEQRDDDFAHLRLHGGVSALWFAQSRL